MPEVHTCTSLISACFTMYSVGGRRPSPNHLGSSRYTVLAPLEKLVDVVVLRLDYALDSL